MYVHPWAIVWEPGGPTLNHRSGQSPARRPDPARDRLTSGPQYNLPRQSPAARQPVAGRIGRTLPAPVLKYRSPGLPYYCPCVYLVSIGHWRIQRIGLGGAKSIWGAKLKKSPISKNSSDFDSLWVTDAFKIKINFS